MAGEKRNKWLDIDLDDEDQDDEQGYDSEAAEKRKGGRLAEHSRRTSKRRKLDSESDEENNEEEASDNDDNLPPDETPSSSTTKNWDDQETTTQLAKPKPKPKPKPLNPKVISNARLAAHKTGVIYISRVPPFMKPAKLRSLLTPYGPINRIFLTPEDPSAHSARVRSGGNKKRSYVDGWVEFCSKQDAKMVAETLNTRIIGGKKGGFYHDDVWNIKYLKGFKWNHLTEQIANENAERAARLRSEIARARKEDREFLRNVGRAKMLEGIRRKRDARRERDGEGKEEVGENAKADVQGLELGREERPRRVFRQNEVRSRRDDGGKEQSETVKRVLSKIF